MKINVEHKEVDLKELTYGDMLITDKGTRYLYVADYDGTDCVAVNLDNNQITSVRGYFEAFINEELDGEVVEIVKSDDLELSRC